MGNFGTICKCVCAEDCNAAQTWLFQFINLLPNSTKLKKSQKCQYVHASHLFPNQKKLEKSFIFLLKTMP